MALVDLKSDLSWYGKKPAVNFMKSTDARGFTTNEQELSPSRYAGVQGVPGSMQYRHTGDRDLGKITTVDTMINDNAFGFTAFQQPLSPSLFTGIGGSPGSMFYMHNGVQGLGDIGTTDYFDNTTAIGFTPNAQPLGSGKLPSQFTGVGETTLTFTHNGSQELGVLGEGYTPNANRNDTHFILNDDQTITVDVKGFDNQGGYTIGRNITSEDGFAVDKNSLSDRGIAKRKSQGGTGFPFSNELGFGPYNWKPAAHLGWHIDNKYGKFTGNQTEQSANANYGLALSYTENSPIEDIYNKLNLRDDATPNPGYVKQPFILRGIQKKGKTDPSRWGFGGTTAGNISSTFDLPRGGVLTAIERAAVDVARIGKFLISPRGIAYSVRQFGYQLMNPNVESIDGFPKNPISPNSTKLWTPINTIASVLGNVAGAHVRRHGLLPIDIPGFGTGLLSPSNYGDVHKERSDKVNSNRLVRVRGDLMRLGSSRPTGDLLSFGLSAGVEALKNELPFINTLGNLFTAKTGPNSMLGIGKTLLKGVKMDNTQRTNLIAILNLYHDKQPGLLDRSRYTFNYYYFGNSYTKSPTTGYLPEDFDEGIHFPANRGKTEGFSVIPSKSDYNEKISLAQRVSGKKTSEFVPNATPGENFIGPQQIDPIESFDGGGKSSNLPPGETTPTILTDYVKMSYGKVRELANSRTLSKNVTNIINHGQRSAVGDPNYDVEKEGNGQTYQGKDNFFNAIDNLNLVDISPNDGLIPLKFESAYLKQDTGEAEGDSKIISFRAYISSFNDSFAPGFDSTPDQGRADARYLYSGFERNVSVDFVVVAFNKEDFDLQWKKLQALAKLTYPIYGDNGFYGDFCKLTIGKVFNKMPAYITDLSYDWDNETPWEINADRQAPMYTNVSVSLNILHTKKPSATTTAVYNHIQ